MADSKLTSLTPISTASSVDLFYVAHDPNGTPISARISASSLFYSVPSTGLVIGEDTNLYRYGANSLKTDDIFIVGTWLTTLGNIYLNTDSTPTIGFGTDTDTNLYRNSASSLKTDGSFIVGGFFSLGSITELTISASVVTATHGIHSIDTEGNASTDDLATISGGIEGGILIIRAADSTRTVVVKDMTGNLQLAGDFSMDHIADALTLIKSGSYWYELSRVDAA